MAARRRRTTTPQVRAGLKPFQGLSTDAWIFIINATLYTPEGFIKDEVISGCNIAQVVLDFAYRYDRLGWEVRVFGDRGKKELDWKNPEVLNEEVKKYD